MSPPFSGEMPSEDPARRPLKTRKTAWASRFCRVLLRQGLTPNAVSLLGIVFAAGAGATLWATERFPPAWLWWIAAAAGIQLRLLCNMMDGMLAVEGGLKSPVGELFNEIPDRLCDALILVPLGYAGGTPVSIALGWIAALLAVLTAYIRAVGASLTGKQDFCGPMAKPHRMAAATALCLLLATLDLTDSGGPFLSWGLGAIAAGTAFTCIRRISRLARHLKQP